MTHSVTTATAPLLHLLQVFDADSLGEGEPVAGANVFVAMCASLANLYPPGTCLITPEGNRLPVGMSFVTAGGLTNSLVGEKVLDPIAIIQNNLGDHLAADAAHAAATLAAIPPLECLRVRPPPPPEKLSSIGKLNMTLDPNGFSALSDNSSFQILLGPSRHQGLGELAATPAIFLSTDSPVGFEKKLSQSHRRRPYVRAVWANGPGAEGLEKLLLSVVRGTSLPTGATGPVFIRGYVAASCTVAKLVQSAGAGEETLAANVMWFVDGGSMPPTLGKITSSVPYKIQHRYLEEMQLAWRTRLDYRNEAPEIPFDWQPIQRKWVAFLQGLEPRCPGVTLAARPLLTTLLFGCLKLQGPRRPYEWTLQCVVNLAQFLVERMVHRRERFWLAEQEAQVLALAIKLVEKLQDGPLTARGLSRKKSNLRIGDTRKVLELFDRLGIARRVEDDQWKLTLPVAKAVERLSIPCIDV
jgi:hypothetical protein